MGPEESEKLQRLLRAASSGDLVAQDELWGMLYPKLKVAVRRKVESMPKLANDTSDLASEALQSFFRRAFVNQEFDLNCPTSVWSLLRRITIRHVNDVLKGMMSAKRGGGCSTLSLDALGGGKNLDDSCSGSESDLVAMVPDAKQAKPSDEMEWLDLLDRLLVAVGDETARQILLLRLEHHSNSEIADLLQISIRTVQRHLKAIANLWQLELEKPE